MKKRKAFRVNIGVPLILIVIVMVILAVYAGSALRTSNKGMINAKKTRDSLQSYYRADAEAENILMQLDQVLQKYYIQPGNEALKVKLQKVVENIGAVEAKNDKAGIIMYSVKVDENSTLEVEIKYHLDSETPERYEVIRWELY